MWSRLHPEAADPAAAGAVPAPLLSLRGLTCERDGRRLFAELDLDLRPGECLELTGPNGSGKSTLLRAIAGLYPDFDGTIDAAESLYLGHRAGLSTLLSAAENLRWYAALGGSAAGIAEALERVGMAGYERVPCQQMSAGQQRRVGLARLLLCPASLWLLDEPLTALDAAGHDLVRALIEGQMARGGAVICATHQGLGLARARRLALGSVAPAQVPA
ncbi:MAG: heme ABC exporter ATP-binding protein CcmA [Pseudomonadales bacterium]